MQPTLRSAGPEDEPFLLRVYAGTRAEELERVPWTTDQKQAFIAQQFTAQAAHYARLYEGMSADVILLGGEPAGRLLVARWPEEIRIVDISLLPEFRGHGAGSALLNELMAEAAAAGKSLSIHVESANRALGLYERLGFRKAGETGIYLRMEWRPSGTQLVT